jgi:hypothetical protein
MRIYPIAQPKLKPDPMSLPADGPEKGETPTEKSAKVLPPVPIKKRVQSPDWPDEMDKLDERVLFPMEVTAIVERPKGSVELKLWFPVPCPWSNVAEKKFKSSWAFAKLPLIKSPKVTSIATNR